MTMKYFLTIGLICSLFSISFAQIRWSTSIDKITNTEYDLVLTAKIDTTWKMRGIDDDNGDGPIPFSFEVFNTKNIEKLDTVKNNEEPTTVYDFVFQDYYSYHQNEVNFIQKIYVDDINKDVVLEASFEFMALNNKRAIAPTTKCVKFEIKLDSRNPSKKRTINVGQATEGIYDCDF